MACQYQSFQSNIEIKEKPQIQKHHCRSQRNKRGAWERTIPKNQNVSLLWEELFVISIDFQNDHENDYINRQVSAAYGEIV